ncbi:MAG: hypothetical protein D3904_16575, partial [Candidatus Electrothrix sp. EH2]|nr:hypothetical protein [Candidatus Electrothrix sp. EH2]
MHQQPSVKTGKIFLVTILMLSRPEQGTGFLVKAALEEDVLEQAYAWLCERRKDYSPDSDVRDFRLHWPERKSEFVKEVLSGEYYFSPLQRYCIDGETVTVWAAQDALLLKAMSLVLLDYLEPVLPDCCTHPKGKGGVKKAVRRASAEVRPGCFVLRTDVRQYYDSIDHFILYNSLCDLVPDQAFCRLILRSLTTPVIYQGDCRPVDKGLSRSNPLSPLLGAIALLPLDQAMQKQPVFYCRYMDDRVLIAKSRWQLKRAVKKMHRVLSQLGFELHPDKTFIGRVKKGFDFLGYR